MKYKQFVFAAGLGLSLASPVFGADQYAIDPAHTNVGFSVQHLVINRVHGNFTAVSGEILYDEEDVTRSSVKVVIQTASINTNQADRDKHLKSADFFDAEKYPEITFQSTKIEKRDKEGYLCVGTLTMHGVSKEVAIPFEVTGKVKDPRGKTRIGIEANLTLNRLDYGISWNKALEGGGLVVGNSVRIALNVEAIKQEAASLKAEERG